MFKTEACANACEVSRMPSSFIGLNLSLARVGLEGPRLKEFFERVQGGSKFILADLLGLFILSVLLGISFFDKGKLNYSFG